MILVVSTDPEIRSRLVRAIEPFAPTIVTGSVPEALGLACEATAIVLDLIGQGINGAAFSGVSAPLVVLSTFGPRPVLIADRVMKPFTLERLQSAVAETCVATPGHRNDTPSQEIANAA